MAELDYQNLYNCGATGIHGVFFRFTGGSGYLLNFSWWKFNTDGTSTPTDPVATPNAYISTVAFTGTCGPKKCFFKIEFEEFNDIKSSTMQKIGTAGGGSGIDILKTAIIWYIKILTSEQEQTLLKHWLLLPVL